MNNRSRKIGTYRAPNGQTYAKYIDDENYVFIIVNEYYITIEGDGYETPERTILKEINLAMNSW